MNIIDWTDCYSSGWGTTLNPEAYTHPAKVSFGLARRIYEYALEKGYLYPGQWVVDPFGGVGGFAYHAIQNGVNFFGLELEQNFVDRGMGCDCDGFTKQEWRRMFGRSERFQNKDGRHLCPRCLAQLNQRPSRPETTMRNGRAARRVRMQEIAKTRKVAPKYTEPLPLPNTKTAVHATKKQLSLFDMPIVETAVYERNSGLVPCQQPHHYQGNIERWLSGPGANGSTAVLLRGDSRKLAETVREWAEGAISSPPYTGSALGNDAGCVRLDSKEDERRQREGSFRRTGYGSDPGQLGNLPEGEFMAAMKSPPYADSINSERNGIDWSKTTSDYPGRVMHDERIAMAQRHHNNRRYGETDGQLGAMKDGGYDAAISSPPFGAGETRDRHNVQAGEVASAMTRAYTQDRQGENEGNLARLDDGQGFAAVVSSPPYISGGHHTDVFGAWNKNGGGNQASSHARSKDEAGYGRTDGQLGLMQEGQFDSAISSPPYADAISKGDGPGVRHDTKTHNSDTAFRVSSAAEYGRTPGNLGNLDGGQFEAAVSSPPWENTLSRDVVDATARRQWARENGISNAEYVSPVDMERVGCRDQEYGRSNGNVGNEQGETFWLAARAIVEQTYAVLKPGAVAIFVVKRFVRDGKIVEFSDQWEQLCTAVGFVPVERIKAWLIEDKGTQLGVFGEHKDKSVKRASFFRRLYEKRFPENAIEWEDVLVLRKPEI